MSQHLAQVSVLGLAPGGGQREVAVAEKVLKERVSALGLTELA